jgi:hypothetical protein
MTKPGAFRMGDGERHAVEHAKYLVSVATPEKPDVCFDYTLVATLLSLVERLRAFGEEQQR